MAEDDRTEVHTSNLVITAKEGEKVTPEDWETVSKLGVTLDKIKSIPKNIVLRIAHAVQQLPSSKKSETDEQ